MPLYPPYAKMSTTINGEIAFILINYFQHAAAKHLMNGSADVLVKHYPSNVAVDGINFAIPQGICFGLLGHNGAGKTTTIELGAQENFYWRENESSVCRFGFFIEL